METFAFQQIVTLDDAEAGAAWRRLPRTFGIRRRLELAIAEFAEPFHIPAELVAAWENGSATPDAAETYLRVIAHDPEHVAKMLAEAAPQRAAG